MITFHQVLRGSAILAIALASYSAALAEGTPEQRSACTGDAFRLCGPEIPDVNRITACMKANFSRLSPPCKAVFVQGPVAQSPVAHSPAIAPH
jgi:hypothetical protein